MLLFCGVSFLFANLGLNTIITYAVPVLMFLYPLAIMLILLALLGHLFGHDRAVYLWVIGLTLPAALYDLLSALPGTILSALHLESPLSAIANVVPLAGMGLGWIWFAALGLIIGLIVHAAHSRPAASR